MSVFSNANITVNLFKDKALQGLADLKNKTKSSAQEMKSAFTSAFAGLGTAYLGAKAFKAVYDDSLKIADLADKWGRPVEGISQFTNKMALLGGTTEDAMNTVDALEQAIVDLRTSGSGPLKEVSAQIGANLYNSNGQIKNYSELLDEIRSKLRGVKDDSVRAKVAQELGLTSPAQLKYLKISEAEMQKINKDAKSYGYLTKKNAKQLQDFRTSIAKLKMAFSSLAGKIMTDFKPVIDLLVKVMDWLAKAPDWVRELILVLAGLKFTGLLSGISNLVGMIGKLAGVKSIFAGLGSVIGGLAAPIAAIAAALGVIWKFYEMWKDGPEKVLDKDQKTFNENLEKGDWLEMLKHPIDTLAGVSSKAGDYIGTGVAKLIDPEHADEIEASYQRRNNPTEFSRVATNTNTNNNVNIGNINIQSTDPKGAAMEFQNILNQQLARGTI